LAPSAHPRFKGGTTTEQAGSQQIIWWRNFPTGHW